MVQINQILTACALLASFAAGYWLADNGWQKKASKEREESATYIAKLSEQHRKKEHELSKNAEALDQKYTESLSAAERRIDELRADLSAGPKRVFVRAKCPSAMSSTSKSEREIHGASPELDDGAKSAYFRLRKGLEMQYSQVLYLQSYIREQCLLD